MKKSLLETEILERLTKEAREAKDRASKSRIKKLYAKLDIPKVEEYDWLTSNWTL